MKDAESRAGGNIIHLLAIRDDAAYQNALLMMEHLMLNAPDTPENPYHELMLLLGNALEAYEERHYPVSEASPAAVLRFLMEQHGLKQADLAADLGGQAVVSSVLNGRRDLNKRQIERLSERFNVSPSVFF